MKTFRRPQYVVHVLTICYSFIVSCLKNILVGKNEILNSLADEIAKLRNLVEQGILTQEEYESAKKKLLS